MKTISELFPSENWFLFIADFFSRLGSFCVVFFFHYVSAKFHLWPSSGDLPRPRIGMLSLVTVSPVITAFHSCLSHHVFDQVNLWPAWIGFETAIFWQCSPGTVETQRLYPLRHGPRRKLVFSSEGARGAADRGRRPGVKNWPRYIARSSQLNVL